MIKDICAGIVLFNPDINRLRKNIKAINGQVKKVYLYDNNSKNILQIEKLVQGENNLYLIKGRKNEGIAYALNRIIDIASREDFTWCLTLDQDSICSLNLINSFSKYITRNNVAIICPFILNNDKYSVASMDKLNLPQYQFVTDPMKCITSASLTNVEIVKHIGGFNERLFIDCVDTDLNCKIMKNGYKILQDNETYLIQTMGKARKIQLLNTLYRSTNFDFLRSIMNVPVYGDLRLYYMSRNSRYIRKHYDNPSKKISVYYMFAQFLYFTIFFPFKRNRIKMWKAIIKGFNDYNKIK